MAEKKGKPTPKRKEAEAKLKVSSLSPGASKEAKRALKEQARKRRMEARAAYMRGEESALPLRDRGAARRFVRNHYGGFISHRNSHPSSSTCSCCGDVLIDDLYNIRWHIFISSN